MNFFDVIFNKKIAENQFKCKKCRKVLNKKYMHANHICVNCFSKPYTPKPYTPKSAPGLTNTESQRTLTSSLSDKKIADSKCAYKFDINIIIGPKDEHLKTIFNPNINNFEEPIFFSNGKMKEDLIHLGTYWHSRWNYEQITLRKADNGWYVCSVAMWPAYSDASNGGYVEILLDKRKFKENEITNADDFLRYFLNGNCKPCTELALNDSTIIQLIDVICKNLYFVKPEEISIVPLYTPSHVGETEHGISLLKKDGRFYLKHSQLYAKPGSTAQYQESIGSLPERINTVSKLYSYITAEFGTWVPFHKQSDDQTSLHELFKKTAQSDSD